MTGRSALGPALTGGPGQALRTPALERAIGRSPSPRPLDRAEPCALCAADLPPDHPHMLDEAAGVPCCVCRACALLFDRPEAAGGRYRRIPDRRHRLAGVDVAVLGVPVGLAFFVVAGDGEVTAHYPSPAGATRWTVEATDWRRAVGACPQLEDLAPGVEALLVDTERGRREAWIVPVADCWRLAGAVRQAWEGLSGGTEVPRMVERFFAQLTESR